MRVDIFFLSPSCFLFLFSLSPRLVRYGFLLRVFIPSTTIIECVSILNVQFLALFLFCNEIIALELWHYFFDFFFYIKIRGCHCMCSSYHRESLIGIVQIFLWEIHEISIFYVFSTCPSHRCFDSNLYSVFLSFDSKL